MRFRPEPSPRAKSRNILHTLYLSTAREMCTGPEVIKDIIRSSRAMAESKPLVASSAKSTEGSVNSSVAKARRRRSPPCKGTTQQFSSSSRASLLGKKTTAKSHFSSPEIPAPMLPMRVFLHFASPSSVISASTRCSLSAFEKTPIRNRHWKSRCSRTVSPEAQTPQRFFQRTLENPCPANSCSS